MCAGLKNWIPTTCPWSGARMPLWARCSRYPEFAAFLVRSVYIKEFQAIVEGNEIASYRVNAKISFVVQE